MDAQGKYIKVRVDGQITWILKPDPKVRKRKERNRGSKTLSFLAAVNGLGLSNLEALNRLAAKKSGAFPAKFMRLKPTNWRLLWKGKSSKEIRKVMFKVETPAIEHPAVSDAAMAAIDLIPSMGWNPDRPAKPIRDENPPKVLGISRKDYSGFPPQKSKSGPKPAKKKGGLTPRTKLFSTPDEYRPSKGEKNGVSRVRAPRLSSVGT